MDSSVKHSSTKLLVIQAFAVTLMSTVFLLSKSINASYWFMLTLATQMYLLMYGFMFTAAIRQAWQEKGHFYWIIILFSILGFIGATLSFIVSFTPPNSIKVGSLWHYDFCIAGCLLLMATSSILWKKILYYHNEPPENSAVPASTHLMN